MTQSTLERLKEAADAAGVLVTADQRIAANDVARLIGWSPGHLANARSEGKGPPYYRIGLGNSKISYRLDDVAAWVDGSLE